MYICICHAIKQSEFEEKLSQCDGNLKIAIRELGLGPGCGSCLKELLNTKSSTSVLEHNHLENFPQDISHSSFSK